ncbi:MAG: NAD+ synthase [Candidatus Melainabacteria bacterium RIFOXYA2_FULL_32_9]|nr:MAG: NAD+ synthase [Candidatus Melainabacteria bacterium RIFOXYA2_FULL_32_9]
MRIALAQINTKVGDLTDNVNKIISYIDKAKNSGAELVIFSELTITGYPPRDLLDFESFVQDNLAQLEKIKPFTNDIGVICGYVDVNPAPFGRKYYNAAALIYKGEIISRHYKSLLPFYDVFDETRYFEPGKEINSVEFLGKKLGISICEDIWNDKDYWQRPLYGFNPVEKLASQGIDIIINLSASPYWLNKEKDRFKILQNIATRHKVPLIYVNQVGGNDDLLFDGVSYVIDQMGELKARGTDFKEDLIIYDTETNSGEIKPISDTEEESLLKALVTGLKDYCHKSGFQKVVLGLSGGIDSAVTAAIASLALGPENVLGITMPSMYSSEGSVEDSKQLAENLGINYLNIPIADMFYSYINNVQKDQGILMDLAEENLQARIRANILMLYSNRYGSLLISTGNKSELSVGYCTLYGDMAGGLAVLSDVPKVMVYRLAHHINSEKEIIPDAVITKAPSAELRPDQKDQDTLPPYEILDDILKEFVEENKSADEIAEKYHKSIVNDVIRRVNNNEYKRRQASLGLKVTTKAFGSGRRIPIVQGYKFGIE